MAIALASTAHNKTTTNTITVSKPTGGWVSGNVLVALVCGEGGGSALATPSGWTLIDSDTTDTGSHDYYHVCGASEPTSYSWVSSSGTPALAACVLEYSGVDNTTPVNAHSVNPGNSADKTIVFLSVTPTVSGCELVALGAVEVKNVNPTVATPTGFTAEVSDSSAKGSTGFLGAVFAFDRLAVAGATGSASALISTSSTAANTLWAGYFVALAPTPAGTTFSDGQAESNTAADSQAVIVTRLGVQGESATAADAQIGNYSASPAESETNTAADSQTGGISVTSVIAENVTAAAAQIGLPAYPTAQAETDVAADTSAATAARVAAQVENGVGSESQSATDVGLVAQSENVAAVSVVVAAYDAAAFITESVTASDASQQDTSLALSGDLTEVSVASEVQTNTAGFVSDSDEVGVAGDGSTAGKGTSALQGESGTAVDSQDAQVLILVVADIAEAANALSQGSALVDFAAAINEGIGAADAMAAIFSTDVVVVESASASDLTVGGLDVFAIITESDFADDVADAVRTFSVDIAEAVAASDINDGTSDAYVPTKRPNSVVGLTVPFRSQDAHMKALLVVQVGDRMRVVSLSNVGIVVIPSRVVTMVKP